MTSAPLDNLVISQLAALRNHEAALQQQILSTSILNAGSVQLQILELRQRADRLNRMLDAMDINGGCWQNADALTPAAA